jgi:RNA polymerase sigma-70 factor (ECF subfamily)
MSPPAGAVPDSASLLGEARAGAVQALGELTERYRPYLLRMAARLLDARLPGESSSVVQDAFLAALRGFGRFRGNTPAEFLSWLAEIVRNRALTRLRRAGRINPLAAAPGGEDEVPASGSSPSEQAERRESAARLLEAVHALPPDCREVISLRNFQGLPFEEVAARMRRSSDAVRQLWVRAVRRLREVLGGEP